MFRIKDEVYSAGARGTGSLKRIADEVIGTNQRQWRAEEAGAEPPAPLRRSGDGDRDSRGSST